MRTTSPLGSLWQGALCYNICVNMYCSLLFNPFTNFAWLLHTLFCCHTAYQALSALYYFSGCCSNNIIVHQPSCPLLSVSPDTQATVSSILLADSMGKSFPQNNALMKVVTMASSNYYYASGLIVGQLLDISRFPQVFTLLGLNLLKSWNNKQLLKEAMQNIVENVAAANSLARIFIGSIIPHLGAKQQTLNHLKEFNWATRKTITKLCKKSFTEEYINIHKLFLNDDGSLKVRSSWRPVASYLKSSRIGNCFCVPCYLIQHYFLT